MDKICIRRLEVYAHHGVYEEEKRLGQKFYITVEMELDTRAAGISDDLPSITGKFAWGLWNGRRATEES